MKPILFILMMTLLMAGCKSEESEVVLTEVKGDGLTYSEYFKSVDELDKRENITYYKPLSIAEMMKVSPESIKNAVHIIDSIKIPFEVNEQSAYLVASEYEKGHIQNQVQFSYLHNSEYGDPEEFLIISVTELDENPLGKYDFSKEQTDTMGNVLRKEILTDDIPIYHQMVTTNSALAYQYYFYDENNERMSPVVTAANELYGYYNGHLYHVGYFLKNNNTKEIQEKILQLTREFILGESI